MERPRSGDIVPRIRGEVPRKRQVGMKGRFRASLALVVSLVGAAGILCACASGTRAEPEALAAATELSPGMTKYGASTLDATGPIPLLCLSGTPYEQGYAYGVLARERLASLLGKIVRLRDTYGREVPWPFRGFAKGKLEAKVKAFEKRTPQRYLDEMRGLSDGSGIAYRDVLFWCSGATMLMGCTSVLSAADPGNGGLIHGRNFDFGPWFLGEHPIIVRYDDGASVPAWNLSILGYLPGFNACNERGVAVSINMSSPNERGPYGIPMGWKIREVIRTAATLAEARSVLLGSPNDIHAWIGTVSSASEGKGIVFDLKEDAQAETPWSIAEAPRFVFNRAFGDGRHVEDGLAKAYADPAEVLATTNVRRWDASREYLAKNGVGSPEGMWNALATPDWLDDAAFARSNGIAGPSTLYTIVFDLVRKRLFVAADDSWSAWAPAWRLDLETKTFEAFRGADPRSEKADFVAAHERWLELKRLEFAGKLAMDALDETLDPLTLVELGAPMAISKPATRPAFLALVERARKLHPADELLPFVVAYFDGDKSPARVIDLYEPLFRAEGVMPLDDTRAGFVAELATAYAKAKRPAEAEARAREWLAWYGADVARFDRVDAYAATRSSMEKLVK